MKVEKLDHVHIRVKDLKKAAKFFSDLLGTKWLGPIEQEEFGSRTAFDSLGLEMVEPITPDAWLAKEIEARGEGLMAIAFKVTDLEQAVAELQAKGVRLVGRGEVGNIKAAVFHPKDTYGVGLELVEYEDRTGASLANLGRLGDIPSPI